MMTTTLNLQERLRDIEALMPQLEQRAGAEAALLVARGDSGPLAGARQKRDELRQEANDIRLQLRGHEISKSLDELMALDKELVEATERREAADAEVRRQGESPIIQKWLAAPSIATQYGYRYSFDLWAAFILSGRAIYNAAPECALFFRSPECPEALQFNLEDDREHIVAYHRAKDEAQRASLMWTGAADRRQRLLQEHPELKAAT